MQTVLFCHCWCGSTFSHKLEAPVSRRLGHGYFFPILGIPMRL